MGTSPTRWIASVLVLSWLLWSSPATAGVSDSVARARLLDTAAYYVGHTEQRPNRSPAIDTWNRYCGAPLGSPYCASYVSWCLASVRSPVALRTAASRRYASHLWAVRADYVAAGWVQPQPGWVVVWVRNGGGHVGFVTAWRGRSGFTIEANTSNGATGSQWNGNGVFRRSRSISKTGVFRITHFLPVFVRHNAAVSKTDPA